MLLLLAMVTLAAGCGGTSAPKGISDAGERAVSATVPEWFPDFPPPPQGIIIDVIDRPSTGVDDIVYGRSVTWRVDRAYQQVVTELDRQLANLGWIPVDRRVVEDAGSQRTTIYVRNDQLEMIQVYRDEALKGVRVTIELPPD
ncbi:MAG: hypothetical protein ACKV2O_12565 [Acidimicrobiales bacterium]